MEFSMPTDVLPARFSRSTFIVMALAVVLLVLPAFAVAGYGVGFSTAMSGSMQPNIGPGDLLVSNVVDASSLQIGEIVILMNKTTMEMQSHRITAISANQGSLITLTTKGDANNASDGVQDIDGRMSVRRVAMIIPNLGVATNYFMNNLSIFLIGFLILATASYLLVEFRAFRSSRISLPTWPDISHK